MGCMASKEAYLLEGGDSHSLTEKPTVVGPAVQNSTLSVIQNATVQPSNAWYNFQETNPKQNLLPKENNSQTSETQLLLKKHETYQAHSQTVRGKDLRGILALHQQPAK